MRGALCRRPASGITILVLAFLISLALQGVAIAAPDAYEPDDDSTQASVITPDSGSQYRTIDPAAEADYIRVDGVEMGYYRVEATSSAGLPLDIQVWDETLTNSLGATAHPGSGGPLTLDWEASGSATFFIRVVGANGAATGDYEIAVSNQSAFVEGVVTDGVSPLAGIDVGGLALPDAVGWWSWVSTVRTDANGRFRMGPLRAGALRLSFSDPGGVYCSEWYDDVFTTYWSDWRITQLRIEKGLTTGVDASLQEGGRIVGEVSGPAGPVGNAVVTIYRFDPQNWWVVEKNAYSNESGEYVAGALPPGDYALRFTASGFAPMWYDGQSYTTSPADARVTKVRVSAGEVTPGVNATLQEVASISGTIGLSDGARGITVTAYRHDPDLGNWDYVGSTARNSGSGEYALMGLSPGRYRFLAYETAGNSLYPTWGYPNAPGAGSPNDARLSDIVVSPGENRAGVDFTIYRYSTLSGTLRWADGSLATGASAHIYRQAPDGTYGFYASVSTDGDGAWTASALPGKYSVGFSDVTGAHYSEYYNKVLDATSPNDKRVRRLTLGLAQDLTGIDSTLTLAGSISGTVTDEITGEPLPGTQVVAYSYNAADAWWEYRASSTSLEDGSYVIRPLPVGKYRITFQPPWDSEYLNEMWPDTPVYSFTGAGGQDVDLGLSEVRTAIDASLIVGGHVTGTVKSDDGFGIEGVYVSIRGKDPDNRTVWWGSASTGADGTYDVPKLGAGDYRVVFHPSQEYLYEGYDDVPTRDDDDLRLTPVTVAPPGTTTGVDATLSYAGHIRGTVTRADSGVPVGNASVSAYRLDPATGKWREVSSASLNELGEYDIGGLRSGDYAVVVTPWDGDLVSTVYPGVVGENPAVAGMATVSVTAGSSTEGIDFALGVGGTISGTVRNADTGEPQYVIVWVIRIDPTTGEPIGSVNRRVTHSADEGRYTVSGLPPGTYVVRAGDTGFGRTYFPSASSPVDATRLVIDAATGIEGVDFDLDPEGTVSGSVLVSNGDLPPSPITVAAYIDDPYFGVEPVSSATVDYQGRYSISAPRRGEFSIRAYGRIGNASVQQWYQGATSPEGAAWLTMPQSGVLTGIDFRLEGGMDVSPKDCRLCHGTDFDATHLSQYDDQPAHVGADSDSQFGRQTGAWQCADCHNYPNGPVLYWGQPVPEGVSPFDSYTWECRYCHSREKDHGPRNTDYCTSWCHDENSEYDAYGPHDLVQEHPTNLPDDCDGCHASSLVGEHGLPGRVDTDDELLGCASCHANADSTVTEATRVGDWLDPGKRWVTGASGKLIVIPEGEDVISETVTSSTWSPPGGAEARRVKVAHKGTGESRLLAFIEGEWREVYAKRGTDFEYRTQIVDVEGATEFKWELTSSRWQMGSTAGYSGSQVWVAVSEPQPASPTCTTCHPEPVGHFHEEDHDEDVASWCQPCHSGNLMIEHAAKVQGYDCNMCHGDGVSSAVAEAIASGDGYCFTCHDTHPHQAAVGLDTLANGERPCSDCHSASLVTEHTKTTSSSAAAGCDACHDSGGAREQAGEWDGTCAAVGCHAAGGARPVHEVYCLGCHGVGQQDFAQSVVDFSMPAVDRATACVRCHWKPKHFSHGSTVQCNRCHYSLPTRTDFYFSTVSTAFGQFSSAGSALAGPRQLHAIHTNGSWPQTVKKNPATGGGTTDCASCHAPAACEACHDGGAAHGAHTAGAYPGPSYRATSGKPVASTASDTTFAYTPTCASDSCHSLSATVRTIRTAREQNEPAISYADRWSVLTASQGSGGSLTWTARAGARATYSFEGPGRVTLIGLRNPFGGYATVTLDGAVVDTVDCYSPGTDYGSALYSSPWLGEGTHTIELTATGTRRASSSGAKVYLDRIDTFKDDPGADRFVPVCSSCHQERKVDH